jgi:septal ring factor EnvC (AmiA/AmiB activator)
MEKEEAKLKQEIKKLKSYIEDLEFRLSETSNENEELKGKIKGMNDIIREELNNLSFMK